ncbi:hypothetical protein B0H19DRAFT_720689 [Mycena capillaripes]|nr:hypothetical protein B0H19DRAFT_720689 [Mycena capillaripes]
MGVPILRTRQLSFMAAPAPALPNVELSYGPMIIGVFFNMIFYGVLVGQILGYYQVYKKDALWLRYFVAYLFFVETANTALDISMMYQLLILEYGQQPVFFPTVFMTQPLCVVLISMPIQLFFAWRIYQLTKALWIPMVISLLSMGSFAGGIWTSALVLILEEFAKKPLTTKSALLWFLASCVADVLITISLVITLAKSKTGFVATDSVVDKIIRMTIQTGMITAFFSILDVICFMVLPQYAVNLFWDLALSKLYSNCLISTLNARQNFRLASHRLTSQQQQSVVLSTGQPRCSGKQDAFLDISPVVPKGSVSHSDITDCDLESGIHMTKIVEYMRDPEPRV